MIKIYEINLEFIKLIYTLQEVTELKIFYDCIILVEYGHFIIISNGDTALEFNITT